MKQVVKNIILVVLIIALAVLPFIIKSGAEFAGADDQAEKAISTINSNYQPWFKSVWEPPSSEVESFLFALQAALGSGIVSFYLGYKKGQKSRNEVRQHDSY
ncbi:MAG: energy-coupling factor ABC transporter substrate-binding protein [Desulfitobacterium hafniense]|nr:energy-coupling factor ABC transporter substrate-binding protein [Desulfitobacterium hafniense]